MGTSLKHADYRGPVQLGIVRGVSYGLFGPPEVFVPQARALGAGFVRAYVYWSQVEPAPGVYDWRVLDALLDQIEPGVDVWVTLCSSSRWATVVSTDFQPPSPALDDEAYARFVCAVVRRSAGRVRYWQCNNEPSNAGLLWSGSAHDYVHQLRTMAGAVRAEDPVAFVVLGGCGYDMLSSPQGSSERAFFDVLAGDGRDFFDLFSVHLYDDPYRIPQHIDTVRALMRRHGYDKPVVVGEYNGPTLFDFPAATAALEAAMMAAFADTDPVADRPVQMSTTDLAAQIVTDSPDRRALRWLYERREELPLQLQLFMADAPAQLQQLRDRIACRQLAQRVLLALAAGVNTLACWQLAPEVGNYTDPLNIMDLMFGRLALMDFTDSAIAALRPVAHAHRQLAAFLTDAQSVERIYHLDSDVYAFRVNLPDHRTRLAAWLRHDDVLQESVPAQTTRLPWQHSTAHSTDVFGHTQSIRLTDGQAEIDLAPTPLLISADPLPAATPFAAAT